MQDKGEARAAVQGGDIRTGALLAAAGALLLASTLTRLWAAPPVVPGALAIALLVFGAYLLSIRAGLFAGADRVAGIDRFESHPEPVFISDLAGRLRGANPAARDSGALDAPTARATG